MVRLKTWTGSAWADTRVWDGSQWRAYVPPVYGAYYYREDFSAGPAGWTGYGGTNGTQFGIGNWSNVHVYIDTNSGWVYPDYGVMERAGTLAAPIMSYVVRPGQTVRAQMSLYRTLVAGSRPLQTSYINAYINVACVELGDSSVALTAAASGTEADWGWGVLTTDAFTIPAVAGDDNKPRTLKLVSTRIEHYSSHTNLGDPSGQWRLYMDWFRLIGNDGNELMRQTSPASEPLRVWTGSAWV
jgi:hypothetical protein